MNYSNRLIMNRAFLFAAAGLLATLGLGCNPIDSVKDKVSQKIGEKVAEGMIEGAVKKDSGKDVDVDLKDGGFSFKDEKTGQVFAMGDEVKIPDNFPADVPRYPGATPKSVTLNDSEASLMLETEDKADKVVEWYKEEGKKQGWEASSTFDSGDTKILGFEKEVDGKKSALNITIGTNDEDQKVVIVLSRSR